MLMLAITGLLGASMGGASLPVAQEPGMLEVEAPNVWEVSKNDLVIPLGADMETPGYFQAMLARPEGLAAKLNGVACFLSRARGTRFTPTTKAPHPPTLFLTLTLGTCPG